MHYLIGPVLGIVFGTVVSQVDALQVNTIKKVSVFGILYTQVISQPILAAARAHSANMQGETRLAADFARQALEYLPDSDPFPASMYSVATAKLGVESRTQAISRGRELGLFE